MFCGTCFCVILQSMFLTRCPYVTRFLLGCDFIDISSAVLKEFFEGIFYHHKGNHEQLSRGVGVWGGAPGKFV